MYSSSDSGRLVWGLEYSFTVGTSESATGAIATALCCTLGASILGGTTEGTVAIAQLFLRKKKYIRIASG